ncbi:ORF2 [Ceratobasidium endornavirus C]|uniref:ORF2 n=1 Tax=Ceratobasidium endornavirus C TaxID=1908813 RepID=UPI000871038E|nr:ORF2 [Ceratobasidium endornavirus C]AOV81704.1 ORF2 [Ceratobasidium endornavirus C]
MNQANARLVSVLTKLGFEVIENWSGGWLSKGQIGLDAYYSAKLMSIIVSLEARVATSHMLTGAVEPTNIFGQPPTYQAPARYVTAKEEGLPDMPNSISNGSEATEWAELEYNNNMAARVFGDTKSTEPKIRGAIPEPPAGRRYLICTARSVWGYNYHIEEVVEMGGVFYHNSLKGWTFRGEPIPSKRILAAWQIGTGEKMDLAALQAAYTAVSRTSSLTEGLRCWALWKDTALVHPLFNKSLRDCAEYGMLSFVLNSQFKSRWASLLLSQHAIQSWHSFIEDGLQKPIGLTEALQQLSPLCKVRALFRLQLCTTNWWEPQPRNARMCIPAWKADLQNVNEDVMYRDVWKHTNSRICIFDRKTTYETGLVSWGEYDRNTGDWVLDYSQPNPNLHWINRVKSNSNPPSIEQDVVELVRQKGGSSWEMPAGYDTEMRRFYEQLKKTGHFSEVRYEIEWSGLYSALYYVDKKPKVWVVMENEKWAVLAIPWQVIIFHKEIGKHDDTLPFDTISTRTWCRSIPEIDHRLSKAGNSTDKYVTVPAWQPVPTEAKWMNKFVHINRGVSTSKLAQEQTTCGHAQISGHRVGQKSLCATCLLATDPNTLPGLLNLPGIAPNTADFIRNNFTSEHSFNRDEQQGGTAYHDVIAKNDCSYLREVVDHTGGTSTRRLYLTLQRGAQAVAYGMIRFPIPVWVDESMPAQHLGHVNFYLSPPIEIQTKMYPAYMPVEFEKLKCPRSWAQKLMGGSLFALHYGDGSERPAHTVISGTFFHDMSKFSSHFNKQYWIMTFEHDDLYYGAGLNGGVQVYVGNPRVKDIITRELALSTIENGSHMRDRDHLRDLQDRISQWPSNDFLYNLNIDLASTTPKPALPAPSGGLITVTFNTPNVHNFTTDLIATGSGPSVHAKHDATIMKQQAPFGREAGASGPHNMDLVKFWSLWQYSQEWADELGGIVDQLNVLDKMKKKFLLSTHVVNAPGYEMVCINNEPQSFCHWIKTSMSGRQLAFVRLAVFLLEDRQSSWTICNGQSHEMHVPSGGVYHVCRPNYHGAMLKWFVCDGIDIASNMEDALDCCWEPSKIYGSDEFLLNLCIIAQGYTLNSTWEGIGRLENICPFGITPANVAYSNTTRLQRIPAGQNQIARVGERQTSYQLAWPELGLARYGMDKVSIYQHHFYSGEAANGFTPSSCMHGHWDRHESGSYFGGPPKPGCMHRCENREIRSQTNAGIHGLDVRASYNRPISTKDLQAWDYLMLQLETYIDGLPTTKLYMTASMSFRAHGYFINLVRGQSNATEFKPGAMVITLATETGISLAYMRMAVAFLKPRNLVVRVMNGRVYQGYKEAIDAANAIPGKWVHMNGVIPSHPPCGGVVEVGCYHGFVSKARGACGLMARTYGGDELFLACLATQTVTYMIVNSTHRRLEWPTTTQVPPMTVKFLGGNLDSKGWCALQGTTLYERIRVEMKQDAPVLFKHAYTPEGNKPTATLQELYEAL